jgi:hypothetical protein
VVTKRRIAVFILVVGISMVAAVRIAANTGSSGNGSEPPLTDLGPLLKPLVDETVGFTIAVPAPDYKPGITAQAVLDKMWSEEGAPGDPTDVEATYGVLTWGGMEQKDRPVWVLTYHGTCVVTHGPDSDQGCLKLPYHTLADSDTGEYVASYVDNG